MIKIDTYANVVPFPNREISPANKNEAYCIRNAKAIYSLWLSGKTSWGYSHLSYFDEMRRYADGNQSTDQYKSFLKGKSSSNQEDFVLFDSNSAESARAKREGWYNLLWQNLSPAPKIMDGIHGMLDKIDYDLFVDTIDSDSRGFVEFVKWKKFHEAQDIAFQNEYKKNAGIPIDENVNYPRTLEDLEAFETQEGFKLNIAKAMQKLCRHSFNVSDWDGTTKKKLVNDAAATGYIATEDYFDTEDMQFKSRYLDPKDVVIQFSKEYDYKDAEYGGHFKLETITNCKRIRPDVDEDQWYQLAKAYQKYFENPVVNFNDRQSLLDPANLSYQYDCFNVPIFYAYWIDTDVFRKLYFTNSSGRSSVKELGLKDKVTPLTKNQVARGMTQNDTKTTIRNCYQCAWVMDTDITLDWGLLTMGDRPQPSKPRIPIHVEQLIEPSLIYRLRPILDNIALIWLRHQNSMARMIERGYAVNMGMLMGITLNKKTLDPASVLKLWKESGILPYMYQYNGQYGGGAATPVTPIDGGMGARVQETANELMIAFNEIEQMTGISLVATGQSPKSETAVGTSDIAVTATLNVLKPVISATLEIKQSIGGSIMRRMQVGFRVDEDIRDAYSGVVSPADIRSMVMAEHDSVQYGMTFKPRPTDQHIAEIKRYMEIGISAGLIEPAEAMYFTERINMGADLIEIRQQVDYTMKKNRERKQQEAMANINAQGQQQQQLKQLDTQGELQKIAAKGQADAQEEAIRAMAKKGLLQVEENYKYLNQLYADMRNEETGNIVNNGASSR